MIGAAGKEGAGEEVNFNFDDHKMNGLELPQACLAT